MKKYLLPLCVAFAATPVLAQAPSPLDGEWRGRLTAAGGSTDCSGIALRNRALVCGRPC